MKNLLFILVLSVFFVGCNYELKPKEKTTQTVYVLDVGNFTVYGKIDFGDNGRIKFEDHQGRTIQCHMSRCIIVDTPFVPKAQVPVKQPIEASPGVDKNVPENIPKKE